MLLHCVVYGKVQGVGFRYFTEKVANELGVKGWVKNNIDGTVEIMAEADENILNKFLEKIKQGPPLSRVSKVEFEFKDKIGGFDKFEIRY